MFHAQLSQAMLFKRLLESLRDLIDFVTIRITPEELSFQAMDSTHTIECRCVLQKCAFEEFEVETEVSLGVSLISLSKVMKLADPSDSVTLETTRDSVALRVTLKSKSALKHAEFELRLATDALPKARNNHMGKPAAVIELQAARFAKLCKDLECIADVVSLEATKNDLLLEVMGDLSTGHISLRDSSKIKVRKPRKLSYQRNLSNELFSPKFTSTGSSPKAASLGSLFSLKLTGSQRVEKVSTRLGMSLMLKNKGNLSTEFGAPAEMAEQASGQRMFSLEKVSPKNVSSRSFLESSLTHNSVTKPSPIRIASQIKTTKPGLRSLLIPDFAKEQIKPRLPLLPDEVLQHYREELTELEEREIMEYDMIYCIGAKIVKARNEAFDNENADYIMSVGDHVAFRYEILRVVGKGAFGVVARCMDHKMKQEVALKMIKNKKMFLKQGLVEVKVLQIMRERDKDGTAPVVTMKSSFMFRKHLCITFELLSISLYEFMRANRYQGLQLSLVRKFAVQILKALIFLKKLKIIHCDLKPENVLLKTQNKAAVKLIDFGSACFESSKIYTYIQSRYYRAPEIILSTPYTNAIDMWSFGCILVELARGTPVFPGESEKHQLGIMMEVLGAPPNVVLARSSKRTLYFDSLGAPRIFHSSKGRPSYPNTTSLSVMLQDCDPAFIDLAAKCLDWNPMTRITPDEAIRHPWITSGEDTQSLSKTMSGLNQSSLRIIKKDRRLR